MLMDCFRVWMKNTLALFDNYYVENLMPILAILVILYVVIDGGLKAYADRN
jgi:hypothetical protein